jgi:hypothetical protein
MLKIKAKSEAKKKPGRKASGLRDLPPEAARYAVNKAMVAVVHDALHLQRDAAKLPGSLGGAPTLARMLKGDLEIASLRVVEDGEVALRPVLRSTRHIVQMREAGVPEQLLFTAAAFTAAVDGATIGKLTGGYGEGFGGGASPEPERVLCNIDLLAKASKDLTSAERFTVWSALVFGLALHDIGWSLYGMRGWTKTRMIEAAALHLECGLERMEPWFLARA